MLKKVISTIVASVLVFSNITLANVNVRDARQVLLDSSTNTAETTALHISGELGLSVTVTDSFSDEQAELVANFYDLEISMYTDQQDLRLFASASYNIVLPEELSWLFGSENEIVGTSAILIDNGVLYVYENGVWTIESEGLYFDFQHDSLDLYELTEISSEFTQFIIELLPIVFANNQPDGYYAIELRLNNESLLEIVSQLITVDFIEDIATIVYVTGDTVTYNEMREFLDSDHIEEDLAYALAIVTEGLDLVSIEILYVYYINQETEKPSAVTFDVTLDTGNIGFVQIQAGLTSNFSFSYDVADLFFPAP